MSKFAFVAVAPDGAPVAGTQEAATLAAARLALVQRDLRIVRVEPKRSWTQLEITPARIRPAQLMHVSRQLAAFLRAGIPILDAITTLAEESDRSAVRRVLTTLADDLRAGSTLTEALDRHPNDFPEWYRGILRSAELTGHLDDVLDQLSQYLERDLQARKQITSALTYPVIVAAMSVVTIGVLSIYVLPKFQAFFASLDAELPLPTRMLLAATDFMAHWWWAVLGGVLGTVLGGFLGALTRAGRLLWHRFLLVAPVIGPAVRYSKIERFTRLMASMTRAGVALPAALTVAAGSLDNLVFENALARAREAMLRGEGLARPIAATGLFPGVAAQMIRVGEDTGTMDTQLEVAAKYYERELGYKIQRVTTVIEPAVIIVMGLIVGFVAIALVSAMYGIFRTAHM